MFHSVQKKPIDSMSKSNTKDKSLFRVIKLIFEHNMTITKIRQKIHMDLLGNIEHVPHHAVVDAILKLSIIIE